MIITGIVGIVSFVIIIGRKVIKVIIIREYEFLFVLFIVVADVFILVGNVIIIR